MEVEDDGGGVEVLCLGAEGAGKTLLLRRLQSVKGMDDTCSSVPTLGTTIKKIMIANKTRVVREVGGGVAPLWRRYYSPSIRRIMFVVDASNLCQISAAGVLLYSILSEPAFQKAKVLLVLTKMDASYRQMRNEALLMLQMNRLKREVKQAITIVEASSFTSEGIDNVFAWLKEN